MKYTSYADAIRHALRTTGRRVTTFDGAKRAILAEARYRGLPHPYPWDPRDEAEAHTYRTRKITQRETIVTQLCDDSRARGYEIDRKVASTLVFAHVPTAQLRAHAEKALRISHQVAFTLVWEPKTRTLVGIVPGKRRSAESTSRLEAR